MHSKLEGIVSLETSRWQIEFNVEKRKVIEVEGTK